MEIVLALGFADVIFRSERSDDRKYVCGSQARTETTTIKPVNSPFQASRFTSLNVTNRILCNTSSNSPTLDHTKLFINVGLSSIGN